MTAFFTSIGIACLVTTLLAVLMVIVDAYLNDYGELTLTINDDKTLKVEGGSSLLATLKEHEIFIPSACGGRGSCGLCKLQITEGAGELLPTETPWLTDEEENNNTRLTCQVKVRSNMRILIPEEMLSVKQFKATVTSLRDLTYDIKEVSLKLQDPGSIEFSAGQFVQLEVPEYELTDEPVYRAYSIASPPSSHNRVEMEIRFVPDGICTTYVHRHLKEGDTVTINGPYGEFQRSDSQRDMICIAGGSGMAPIKSIVLDMLEKNVQRKVQYFFGARSSKDLFLVEEMKTLESQLPLFSFIPALSEPGPGDNWNGETGLITEVVAKHVDEASDKEAYLCGSPFMIDACIAVLKEKGMPEENIFYDKFV
jgi:Na+-transporting NADH:ubiquinone oxidoreductase subunit F